MLKLSVTLKEISVEIECCGGVIKNYALKELTGTQRDAFLDDVGGRVRFVGGKAKGLNTHKNLQANLVAMCLYDEENKSIKLAVLQEFPASALSALFKAAQELSGLKDDDEIEEEVKND